MKSNFQLLFYYGFIDPDNDEVTSNVLFVILNEDDPMFDLKKEILGSKSIRVFSKAVPSNEAFSIFRIAFFDDLDSLKSLEAIKTIYQ